MATKVIKYQVYEDDTTYGNGIWIDPVLYDDAEEAQRHCHSYRGWFEKVEVEIEQV
jgi:hypothetical protein